MSTAYWLIVPAAGRGRRFGTSLPKQYTTLNGRAVIEWSLAPFVADPRCVGVVVALSDADEHWPVIESRLGALRDAVSPLVWVRTIGGAERADSVRHALNALAERISGDDWVMVHDAARPCVSPAEIEALVAGCTAGATGGLLALAANETLKRADGGGRAGETLPREQVWRAQTPQMFQYAVLSAALAAAHTAGRVPTDESQAMEWQGHRPLLVAGCATNLKITDSADLELAAAILAARQLSRSEA